MELSEITGIVDILVTLVIGFWLTRYLGNRDTRSRVLKDFYIEEAKDLQNDVRIFFARLLSNHVTGSELSRWHKSHKNKFKAFDESVRQSFPIECPFVNAELFKIHSEITNLEEFNNAFSTGSFNFTPSHRARIDELECTALTLLNDYVVQVNNSSGLGYFDRILHDLKHEFKYYVQKLGAYWKYLMIWIWRIVKVVFIGALIYIGFKYFKDKYEKYTLEKQNEKLQTQRNIKKALDAIEVQNAKLDSIDSDLRNIKENMRIRKGVNNYWIHTNCSETSEP